MYPMCPDHGKKKKKKKKKKMQKPLALGIKDITLSSISINGKLCLYVPGKRLNGWTFHETILSNYDRCCTADILRWKVFQSQFQNTKNNVFKFLLEPKKGHQRPFWKHKVMTWIPCYDVRLHKNLSWSHGQHKLYPFMIATTVYKKNWIQAIRFKVSFL